MTEKTACFTGHRDIPAERLWYVKEKLRREIKEAIADGYEIFMSGFAEGADQIACGIVLELKEKYPHIRLDAAIPYRERLQRLMHVEETKTLLMACSDIGIWSEDYHRDCFMIRNKKMLELSARVIAVYDGREKGGTAQTLRFAHAQKKQIREIRI